MVFVPDNQTSEVLKPGNQALDFPFSITFMDFLQPDINAVTLQEMID